MGWQEGQGLGASKQGIKEHIKVKKKLDNWGLGAVEAADRARDWSLGMTEYHRVLSTLSEITSKHADIDEDEDSSEEDEAELKKSKKKEKRKRKEQDDDAGNKKKRRKKSKDKSKKTRSSSSDDDAADDGTTTKNKRAVKTATHLGRFKKRESAKMVQNYSTHDLAAILGQPSDPFAAFASLQYGNTTRKENLSGTATSDEDDEGDDSTSTDNEDNNSKVNTKNKKDKKRICIEISIPEDQQRIPNKSTNNIEKEEEEDNENEIAKVSWWKGYFTRSTTRLGAGPNDDDKKEGSIKTHGFSEHDQTNLFNMSHQGKTQGKVGLGRSSMAKKVGGVRWAGTKMAIDSDDDDKEEEEKEEGREEEKNGSEEGVSVKWKSVAQEILELSRKKKMKFSKLVKQCMAEYKKKKNTNKGSVDDGDIEVVSEEIKVCLQKSGKFVITGSSVSLK